MRIHCKLIKAQRKTNDIVKPQALDINKLQDLSLRQQDHETNQSKNCKVPIVNYKCRVPISKQRDIV